MNETKLLLNQITTYCDLLKLRGTQKYSVREMLPIADMVYPLIDALLYDYPVKYRVSNPDSYLGFDVDFLQYAGMVSRKAEELFGYPIPEIVEEYIWNCITGELEFFMNEEAPNREHFLLGDMYTATMIIQHHFRWGDREDCWYNYTTEDKLEYIAEYGSVTINTLIGELEEVIFWEEFGEKVKNLTTLINSEEYADSVIEWLKENFDAYLTKDLQEV